MGNPKGVERDFDELEKRRLKAARLFDRGLHQGEVARRLGVHRQSVSRWHQAWKKQGTKALCKAARAGRRSRLQPVQLEKLSEGLKAGPEVLGYAPELNPVEYIWGYCKQHELPNLCPKDFPQLSWAARKALGRMRRRPTLVKSFWKQAELF